MLNPPGGLARLIQAQHELRSVTQRGGQEQPAMHSIRRLHGGALLHILGDPQLTVGDEFHRLGESPVRRTRIDLS